MVYAIKKNDIIRIVFGFIAALLFVLGLFGAINDFASIVKTIGIIGDEFSRYFGLILPSFFAFPAKFLYLISFVLFGAFLFLFSNKNKKLISAALVLSAVSSLLFSISYILLFLYPTKFTGVPIWSNYFKIYILLSIVHLALSVLFVILAVEIGKTGENIKKMSLIAIVFGLLPSIAFLIYYIQAGRLQDLNLFKTLFVQPLQLTILPIFLLACPQLFVTNTSDPILDSEE